MIDHMVTWTIVGPGAPFKGGVAQHTTELAHRLESFGETVTLESWKRQYPQRLYPGETQISESDDSTFEATNRRLSWNRPDSWIRVGLGMRKRGGRLIFVGVTPFQYPIYLVILFAAGRQARSDSVLIAHNVLPHESSPVDKLIVRLMFKFIGRVVTHSSNELDQALELGARASTASLPLHFEFPPDDPPARNSPAELLAFIGFVRPYKGLDLLIEAIGMSSEGIQLEVMGEFWDGIEKYEQLVDRLSLQDRVTLRPGYATNADVVELLDRCDALVLPYRSATSTQLPRIAFSRGVPVIATQVGDFRDQIRHHVDGVLCPPASPSHLSDAISSFYENIHSLRQNVKAPDISAEWNHYCIELKGMNRD